VFPIAPGSEVIWKPEGVWRVYPQKTAERKEAEATARRAESGGQSAAPPGSYRATPGRLTHGLSAAAGAKGPAALRTYEREAKRSSRAVERELRYAQRRDAEPAPGSSLLPFAALEDCVSLWNPVARSKGASSQNIYFPPSLSLQACCSTPASSSAAQAGAQTARAWRPSTA